MTSKELASMLDGNEYGNEITKEQEDIAFDSRLVVVFGYSDDCVELCGAIDDEMGAYDGTTFHVTRDGVLREPDCSCDEYKYFETAKRAATEIKAIWRDSGEPCWTYETTVPHEIFRIYEDRDLWCCGIVFSLDDLTC